MRRGLAGALVALVAAPVVMSSTPATASAPAPARVQLLAQRVAAPKAPAKVSTDTTGPAAVGIPRTCPVQHAWPVGAALVDVKRQLAANTGLVLVGPEWTNPQRRGIVKIVWETLDSISCTPYLAQIKAHKPHLAINAGPVDGWAWGDWGLTKPEAVSFDFAKWQTAYDENDRGRLVRIIVHELGHVWSQTPAAQQTYDRFGTLYANTGQFSNYGNNVNENFSEVVGYFVARCARNNPYDGNASRFGVYYRLVRDEVFGGRTFGPAVGQKPTCVPVSERVAQVRPNAVAQLPQAPTRVPKEKLDGIRPNPVR